MAQHCVPPSVEPVQSDGPVQATLSSDAHVPHDAVAVAVLAQQVPVEHAACGHPPSGGAIDPSRSATTPLLLPLEPPPLDPLLLPLELPLLDPLLLPLELPLLDPLLLPLELPLPLEPPLLPLPPSG